MPIPYLWGRIRASLEIGGTIVGDWDLFKVVSVFEKLFRPKLGIFLATSLLALAVMFGFFYFGSGIWEYGGNWLYGALTTFIPDGLSPSFGDTTSLDNISGLIVTLMSLVIMYGAILIFVMFLFYRAIFRRRVPQEAIDMLAEHRSEGIRILNKRPSLEGGFDLWLQDWQGWRTKVITDLDKYFTRAESLSFQRLGVISEPVLGHAEDDEHQHKLLMLSKQLRILENLIGRYQDRV